MEFVIQVECRLAGKVLHRKDVATITREATPLLPERVGLTLGDGKTVLSTIQRAVVTDQVEAEAAAWWKCPHCHQPKRIKDRRSRRVRTTFGEVVVSCRRYHSCICRGGRPRIEWPLRRALPARATPEYSYLLAKWGGRMPYRRAAAYMRALLPLRRSEISYGSVRRCTIETGRRIENRALDRDEYEWESAGRTRVDAANHVQVAIDGTWIRAAPGAYGRQLHVVAGRIERDGRLGGHFAWLPEATGATGAMMKSALDDDGLTSHSRLDVLADGADGLESVVREAAGRPPSQRLDWFHLSMRLRPIEQMVDRVASLVPDEEHRRALQHDAPRLRWQLWHGRWRDAVRRTHQLSRSIRTLASTASGADRDRLRRFGRHLAGLRRYLRSNSHLLFHYARTRRGGRWISTATAESGMNHVVNARMGKRQPMRWSAEGAHLLLQVRCALLDDRLDGLFREWYPGLGTSLPAVAISPAVLAPRFVTRPLNDSNTSGGLLETHSTIQGF